MARIKYLRNQTIRIDDLDKVITILNNEIFDNDELLTTVPILFNELSQLIENGYVLKFEFGQLDPK